MAVQSGQPRPPTDRAERPHQEILFSRFMGENPHPVLISDMRGTVVWANPAARKLARGPIEEVMPADHVNMVGSCRMRTGEWMHSEVTIENSIYRFSYLCSQSTSLVHIYGQDVTEERRLERLNEKMANARESLLETGLWLAQELNLQMVLDKTLTKARELLSCRYAAVSVIENGAVAHFYTSGMTDEEYMRLKAAIPTKGLIGHLIAEQKTLRLADIANHPASSGFPEGHPAMHTFLGTPIRYGDSLLGTLYLTEKNEGREFTESDEQIIEMLALQAAVAINNSRLYAEIRKFNQELEARIAERTHELSDALHLAQAASQTKSTFLASMSHELRTPLNAIIGFGEILQDKFFGPLTEKQDDYVADILDSGHHLLSLINDILDIAKIEAGQIELVLTRLRLQDFLEATLVFIREKAAKHSIELRVELDPDMPDILADERRVKQVVFNLLANSSKFTPDGGFIILAAGRVDQTELPDAQRREVQPGPYIQVSVCDNGVGIAPENQGKVFEEFYQIKGDLTGKTPGTGLGLSICKRIIRQHGGAIWLESAGEGKGCCFSFVLPANLPEQGNPTPETPDTPTEAA